MLTKNGQQIICNGFNANGDFATSVSLFKNDKGAYLNLINTQGLIIIKASGTSPEEGYIYVTSAVEALYGNKLTTKTVTNPSYVLQSNNDIDSESSSMPNRSNQSFYTLLLGDGTTLPTVDDYRLEHCITEYIRKAEFQYSDSSTLKHLISLNLEPTQNITINEIGCYRVFTTSSSNTLSNTQRLVLIDRKVLKQPLVLEAGEQYTIDYIIDFRNLGEATM